MLACLGRDLAQLFHSATLRDLEAQLSIQAILCYRYYTQPL